MGSFAVRAAWHPSSNQAFVGRGSEGRRCTSANVDHLARPKARSWSNSGLAVRASRPAARRATSCKPPWASNPATPSDGGDFRSAAHRSTKWAIVPKSNRWQRERIGFGDGAADSVVQKMNLTLAGGSSRVFKSGVEGLPSSAYALRSMIVNLAPASHRLDVNVGPQRADFRRCPGFDAPSISITSTGSLPTEMPRQTSHWLHGSGARCLPGN